MKMVGRTTQAVVYIVTCDLSRWGYRSFYKIRCQSTLKMEKYKVVQKDLYCLCFWRVSVQPLLDLRDSLHQFHGFLSGSHIHTSILYGYLTQKIWATLLFILCTKWNGFTKFIHIKVYTNLCNDIKKQTKDNLSEM